jgi:hypothetical protein
MEDKRTLALTVVEKQYMDRILAEQGNDFKKILLKNLIDYSSIEEIERYVELKLSKVKNIKTNDEMLTAQWRKI